MVISPILDTRRPTSKGYPVKIRVGYNSKADLYPTGVYLSKESFDNLYNAEYKTARTKIESIEDVVRKVCEVNYCVDAVRIALKQHNIITSRSTNLLDWFEYKAKECKSVGNAEEYRYAAVFYYKVLGKEHPTFYDITVPVLQNIEKTQGMNKSLSTIGKYARHLRSVFNMAIEQRFISKDIYPFGKYRYIPPKSSKRKKALAGKDVQALLHYRPLNTTEQLHLDLFAFSYYGNGLNLKDLALLKWRDVLPNCILKHREKTRHSSDTEPIIIYKSQEINSILSRYSTSNAYVFPLLESHWKEQKIFLVLKSLRGKIKRTLTRIGKSVGIDQPIPHGTSRHCFANALKQGGASTDYISEKIGHSSTAVTSHYLKAFEEDTNYQSLLSAYLNK